MNTSETRKGRRLVHSWIGLFDLYQDENNKSVFHAELGDKTLRSWRKLTRGLTSEELDVMYAFAGFGAIAEDNDLTNISDLQRAGPFAPLFAMKIEEQFHKARPLILLTRLLQRGLKDPLWQLINPSSSAENKATARRLIQKRIEHVLDALECGESKQHQNVRTVEAVGPHGQEMHLPLACAVLEYARLEVEKTGDLPTKGRIRSIVEKRNPEVANQSETYWRNLWKDAGLVNLPADTPWTQPLKKRKIKAKTRTKKAAE